MTDRHTFYQCRQASQDLLEPELHRWSKIPTTFFVFDHSERFDIGTSRAKWFVIDRNTDRQAWAWLSDLTS